MEKKTIPECTANKTLLAYKQACGCLPWYLYNRFPNSSTVANYENRGIDNNYDVECSLVEYMACAAEVIDILNIQNETADCLEPCDDTRYYASVSTALYPSTQNYFNTYLVNTYSTDYVNLTQARDNLVFLKIFFEDLKVESEVQNAAYNFGSFIAEVGGMLDMFIGFSFFTIIQLVEIVFGWAVNWRKKRKLRPEIELDSTGSSEGVVTKLSAIFK